MVNSLAPWDHKYYFMIELYYDVKGYITKDRCDKA